MRSHCAATLLSLVALSACSADHDLDHGENEIISRVELTFTPDGGGEPRVFAFEDPDGDGGISGSADRIELVAGTSYTLTLGFENGLTDPPVDLTKEVEDESEEHFVFIVGDVTGPASVSATALLTHSYADLESDYAGNTVGDDLPVGLRNTITADTAGSGQLRVLLRHLPELNGEPQKSGAIPQQLADGEDLPGTVDVDIVFDLTVQ